MLDKAIDLKSKVNNLIQSCSEVSHYLTSKIEEIQKISEYGQSVSETSEKMRKEKESIEKSLQSLKSDYVKEGERLEELKKSAVEFVEKIKSEANRDRSEANEILVLIKQKERELERKIENFNIEKESFDSKSSKILDIIGTR